MTKEVTITRIFDAPRELVFRAWTDPQLLAQWWGPAEFTNPVCEVDVRPGGAILIHMQAPDGSIFPMKGVFEEVVAPERLVFTSTAVDDEAGSPQLETRSTVTFNQYEGKTRLILHEQVLKAEPGAMEALAGMEQGWNESFDRLGAQLVQA